ncbi:Transmembrane_domain-containing protein [Hexamita inflata]|uniref:Transmembrane domain-containing protein n=1 Tax=Hexamita inflata TaxID=28002 RepID=A0AA86NBR5_9EUKA|nr:Transmembrane domain-containing protein [Hexamita inflata]CAI9945510.1 Transmembrane domain-containing protein [Hexamita inflata]CAI9965028.1 Transmembrane domain-containing protein [Hexamita inflata]
MSSRMQMLPVPNVNRVVLFFCGLVNLGLPGFGLMLATCIENNPLTFRSHMHIGIMQLLLTLVVIGFFWSFANGVVMIFYSLT